MITKSATMRFCVREPFCPATHHMPARTPCPKYGHLVGSAACEECPEIVENTEEGIKCGDWPKPKPEPSKVKRAVLKILGAALLLTVVPFLLLASCAVAEGGETDAVAWCLYQEARGESLEGKIAVASVIWNRSKERGLTASGVIFQPKQFSGVGDSVPYWFKDSEGVKTRLPAADYLARADCYEIAKDYVSGRFKPSGDWNHYHALSVDGKEFLPYWAEGIKNKTIIGRHVFMRLD